MQEQSQLRHQTIRRRLPILMALMVLLLTAVLSTVTAIGGLRGAQRQLINQLQSVVTLKEAAIGTWSNNQQISLEAFVSDQSFLLSRILNEQAAETTTTFIRSLLEEELERRGLFHEISVLNRDGITVLSTNLDNEDERHRSQAYFQEGLKAPYNQILTISSTSERNTAIATRPLLDVNTGEPIGVLMGRTDLTALGDIAAERTGLGETGETYIVDSLNFLLSPIRAEERFSKIETDGVETAIQANGRVSGLFENYAGETVLGVYEWIPNLGVVLVAEQSQTEALAPTLAILRTNLFVATGATLLAILLGLLITRTITRPLSNLANTATAVAAGNLNLRADTSDFTEINTLATAFNRMTAQLQELINNLEGQVAQRTAQLEQRSTQLETAALVARDVATVLDPVALLDRIATLITDSFNYYQTGIFLLDEDEEWAVMHAASSEGGKQMLARNHRLKVGAEGIVGFVIANNQARIALDVGEDATHFQNPELPYTRSEMALPLQVGGRVLGALDVQSVEVNAFSEKDVSVLQILADQIAIAIYNARLFESASLARQEAEEASLIKSQFLSSMSHELRTPLNAIINFTGFVADGVLGPINEEQVDILQKVLGSSEHLLSLINDVLDLSKIETGKMDLFLQEVDLNNILRSTAATANGLIKDKPVELHLDVAQNLPHFSGDKRRIRQILLNLVANAIKFTPEGSVTLRAQHEADHIHVAVQDTGVGIPPEEQEQVFEAFHRAQNDLHNASGTGLGLPITKHFVEAHNGQIWLESEVGVGSTIHVTFPITAVLPQETMDAISEAVR